MVDAYFATKERHGLFDSEQVYARKRLSLSILHFEVFKRDLPPKLYDRRTWWHQILRRMA